jgi:hypothetical protein
LVPDIRKAGITISRMGTKYKITLFTLLIYTSFLVISATSDDIKKQLIAATAIIVATMWILTTVFLLMLFILFKSKGTM